MHCSCNKSECDLKYGCVSCDNLSKWKLSKTGEHVLVLVAETGVAENISKLNISAVVVKLMNKIVLDNPDFKAKSVKTHITKQKNICDLLKKDILYKQALDPKYKPLNLPDPNYDFPDNLMPSLPQVYIYFFIFFVN